MAEVEMVGVPGKQAYTVDSGEPTKAYALIDIRSIVAAMAGERLAQSATDSYLAVSQDCNGTIISAQTAVTIGGGVAGDTRLMGVVIAKALTGTCVITGFADGTGTAKSITFPAATRADVYDFKGMLNSAGALTVTCSDVGDDDNVIIQWRPATA